MKIWIDADGAPRAIKTVVFRASRRLSVPVCLVANRSMATPKNPLVTSIVVAKGPDVADSWIVEHVEPEDIVITADIPLAADVVAKGALGISPRGEVYTEANVRSRLSVRDFMHELRDSGIHTGGAPPFGPKDTQRFANALDRELTRRT